MNTVRSGNIALVLGKLRMGKLGFGLVLLLIGVSCATILKPEESKVPDADGLELSVAIKPGGNSWVTNGMEENRNIILESGIKNWTDSNSIIRTYFKTEEIGDLNLGLHLKVASGVSVIQVGFEGRVKQIEVSNTELDTVDLGVFRVGRKGYHFVEIQGLERTGPYYAEVSDILLGGPASQGKLTYVKDDFYWGRRGPSVHLTYTVPEEKDILWFYNEITVPEGEDVLGSYFMANGFAEGYFGIQVNSPSERRVLFSVWSPYETQDPNNIPDEYKIILLGKGEGVTTGEFGNEGSGGQSYKVFNWKAGTTYGFLLKGTPSVNNSTDYTAYFFDPETEKWNLIASFRRPHTMTYIKRPHSFLENFITQMGPVPRMALYSNQWILDTDGEWHELTEAKFTADATARKGSREDYAGGARGNSFYMKNCGFFDEMTAMDTYHERIANETPPEIDFSSLGKL